MLPQAAQSLTGRARQRDALPGVALGAIISPTDAVATSVIKQASVSKRVVALLDGESLLNDASALVVGQLNLSDAQNWRPVELVLKGASRLEQLEASRDYRLAILAAQRAALLDARDDGTFDADILQDALANLDADQIAIELRSRRAG